MFRIGDRVRILNPDDRCGHDYCVGLTGIVAGITGEDNSHLRVLVNFDDGDILACRSDGRFCWYHVDSLELIEENLGNVE